MNERVEERWSSVPFDSWYRCRFLCLYACLGWELHLNRTEIEQTIRQLQQESRLPAYLQWLVELYSESRTSLEEGRAVLAHLLFEDNGVARARLTWSLFTQLLPKSKLTGSRSHPLLSLLERISRRSGRDLPAMDRDAMGLGPTKASRSLPEIERELAFNDFLSTPGFRDAFQAYWRKGPKNRNCRQTRVLILIASMVAICSNFSTEQEIADLKGALQEQCHFSEQTADNILSLVRDLHHEQLDYIWLALSFATDATDRDLRAFADFVQSASEDPHLLPGKRMKAQAIHEQLSLFV